MSSAAVTSLADLAHLDHLWVWHQSNPWHRPVVTTLARALTSFVGASYGAISHRVWPSAQDAQEDAGACAYLPIFDFDGQAAVADAEAFAAQVLAPMGLVRGVDFHVAVSSPGRRKIYICHLLPLQEGWADCMYWWSQQQQLLYPSLDPAMARQPLARWITSSHRKAHHHWKLNPEPTLQGWFQMPTTARRGDGPGRARPTAAQKLALGAPAQLHSSVPLWAARIWDGWTFARTIERTPDTVQSSAKWRHVDYGAALDAAGVPHIKRQHRSGIWSRLQFCPVCGKSEGAPAISPKGWLSCLRSSCPAHGGLPPSTRGGGWAALLDVDLGRVRPARHGARGLVRAQRDGRGESDLEACRERLPGLLQEALLDRRPVVIKATPGVGKSTTTMRALHSLSHKGSKCVLLAPTRELAMEQAAALRAMGARPVLLEGRSSVNCARISTVQAAAGRGYQAGVAVCPRCPYRRGCPYYDQLQDASASPLVVSVWEHLWLVDSGRLRPQALVIDEFPARAYLEQWEVSKEDLGGWLQEDSPPAVREAVMTLAHALLAVDGQMAGLEAKDRRWPRSWRTPEDLRVILGRAGSNYLASIRGAVLEAAAALDVDPGALQGLSIAEIAALPTLRVPQLLLLVDHILRQPGQRAISLSVLWSAKGGARFAVTRVADLGVRPAVVLDGYGRQDVYERLLGTQVAVREVRAKCLARVWQIPISTSKAAFARRGQDIRRQAAAALEALRFIGHRRILVVTHQSERQHWEGLDGVAVRHFGQGVGVNTYRHTHTACLVVGTPRHPHHALLDMAGALHEGDAPLDEARPESNPHTYVDSRLATILQVAREDEIAQAVHRIGLAIPPAPDAGVAVKDVCLVGSIELPQLPPPVEVPPDHLTQVAAIARFATARGWWANFMRELVEPEVVNGSRRAMRRYDAAVKVGVGQLPFVGKASVDIDGQTAPLGFVWGDVDRARTEAEALVRQVQGAGPWSANTARQLGRQLGLCR